MSRRIGCGASALTVLFREATKVSRLVVPIHEALGKAPPLMMSGFDDELLRVLCRWPSLTGAQRATIATLVGQLAVGVARAVGGASVTDWGVRPSMIHRLAPEPTP